MKRQTKKRPRLTTRRKDVLTLTEIEMLMFALDKGVIWLIHGRNARGCWDAAFALQRLGYLAPTIAQKPETGGNSALGWKITASGCVVLRAVTVP